MRTFGELREEVLQLAGTPGDHFRFQSLSDEHAQIWAEINECEYRLGYNPIEYFAEGSLPLCDLKLLTEECYRSWITSFRLRCLYTE